MLTSLSIRDVVLIDKLDLHFEIGLCVLTGETGAGKSILLDALGLALGGRSDVNLIRHGADHASVTAAFDVRPDHPAYRLLHEHGLSEDGPIILRRLVGLDGRTRAYINDRPASVGLLREVGDLLVEIQGQFEQRGLLDPETHLAVLDAYAGLTGEAYEAEKAYKNWRETEKSLRDAEAAVEQAKADEDFIRHSLEELDLLEPKPDEEETLSAERQVLMNREKLVEAMNAALAEVGGTTPVDESLRKAQAHLERVADKAGDMLSNVIDALDRATVEAAEAIAQLEVVGSEIGGDEARQQAVDDRLFALRDAARKHRVTVADLPRIRDEFRASLDAIDNQDSGLEKLRAAAAESREAFVAAAEKLSEGRKEAARRLDEAVAHELPPLKLENATFHTRTDPRPEAEWGPRGTDNVAFEVSTNPGTPLGPIGRIASGGELARFMLALKVVLAQSSPIPTLVFDEVDSGVGGATAAAVGERLDRLGDGLQVLVVTHSPQVAARGQQHLRVEKSETPSGEEVVTDVQALEARTRREEIARMLSGHDITDEARAAADRLIAGGRV